MFCLTKFIYKNLKKYDKIKSAYELRVKNLKKLTFFIIVST